MEKLARHFPIFCVDLSMVAEKLAKRLVRCGVNHEEEHPLSVCGDDT